VSSPEPPTSSPAEVGTDAARPPLSFDTSVPHPARRYNYWLGGKDNFAADRASGDVVETMFPTIRLAAMENRRFLVRAVDFLVREAGIDQFLDIGTGIPSADNTHEVAQRISPAARVVYVDNDPIVLVHARALLTSHPEGATTYLDADLRAPDSILGAPSLRSTLDLSRPVALMLVAVLHFIHDDSRPYELVRHLVDALPVGSYLVMSHATHDYVTAEEKAGWDSPAQWRALADFRFRSQEEFARFFEGHELIPPGIVPLAEWRPATVGDARPDPATIANWCGVARLHPSWA
jgi:hypothetical protein